MKPYFEDASATIYCGDMRELVPTMGRTFDVVVTDPPYGETSLSWDQWPTGWPSLLTSASNQLWCFGSMRMFIQEAGDFAAWKFAQDVIWEKHNGSGLHADRFRRVHETAVHFYRGEWSEIHKTPPVVTVQERSGIKKLRRGQKPQHFGSVEAGSAYEYDGNRIQRSVIECRSCHGYAEHPTQKPEGIVRPLLQYSVPPGGSVLDCFMGSGTTLVVAKQLGMRAVGIEADEAHCETAANRLSQVLALTTT